LQTENHTKPILLFDDECGVCRHIAYGVRKLAKNKSGQSSICDRPIGNDPEMLRKLNPNLDIWNAYATIHVVMPDGSMKLGGEAVAEVLRSLSETRWFTWIFALSIFGFRPFQAMLNLAYAILADVRPIFGCESCGSPVAWVRPIRWMIDSAGAVFGLRRKSSAIPHFTVLSTKARATFPVSQSKLHGWCRSANIIHCWNNDFSATLGEEGIIGMTNTRMKAVLMLGYGNVDRLVYEDAPVPQPASGDVLVKMIAASINPIDWKLRRGDLKDRMPLTFPAILGRDLSGEIVALGEGVTSFRVGERVFGLVNHAYAEYVVCKPDDIARIPETLDIVDAAALPLVLLTGSQVIELGMRPLAGETILVTGAIGGVGRTAVYVAKQHGVHTIAGVRASQRKEAELLGADRVIALDNDKEIASLPELDGVADMVGHETIDRILPHIRKNGTLATVVGRPSSADGRDLRVVDVWAHPDSTRLEALGREVARGSFSIPIDRKFKLLQIQEAQQLAEGGGVGKIILTP